MINAIMCYTRIPCTIIQGSKKDPNPKRKSTNMKLKE